VKMGHESAEKTKPKYLGCVTSVIFRSNKIRSMLETHSTKAAAIGKSNNAAACGRSPQAAGSRLGGRGGAPVAATILQLFSQNTHFRHILV